MTLYEGNELPREVLLGYQSKPKIQYFYKYGVIHSDLSLDPYLAQDTPRPGSQYKRDLFATEGQRVD